MKKALLTAAFVLTASVATAECTRGHEQAMSCADGQSYDAQTGACVPLVSS
ncbi:chitin-binding domain-containing protein [Lentibacter sp.]|uniref:chitin-binding domain-containing protein n=1 Tax=Lentibacter sp. TaxID=2024994 RepID=UPI003F6C0EE1